MTKDFSGDWNTFDNKLCASKLCSFVVIKVISDKLFKLYHSLTIGKCFSCPRDNQFLNSAK